MVSRGIFGQRGFLKFCLVNKLTGNSSIVAVNPANPSYRSLEPTAERSALTAWQ